MGHALSSGALSVGMTEPARLRHDPMPFWQQDPSQRHREEGQGSDREDGPALGGDDGAGGKNTDR